jgi:beta-lactamase class A
VLPPVRTFAPLVALLTTALGCASPRAAPSPLARPAVDDRPSSPRGLEAALEAIARESSGTVAVTVVHVERGEKVSVHGGVRLPMMSVFKLPLAVVALAAVDAGRLSLSSAVPLDARELRRGVSLVAEAWDRGERAPTLGRLVETAVEHSDNTSGDKLVTLLGGGPRITAELRALGYPGIDVAEEEIAIAARIACPGASPPPGLAASAHLAACLAGGPPSPERAVAAAEREASAPPNGASTDALAALLVDLARGTLLSERSRTWLLAAMERSPTGPMRLRAGLPAGARLAHKTGTGETISGLNVATNDVGIVTLPDGAHLVVAVMTSKIPGDGAARDRVIARVAQEVTAAYTRRDR